jgi:hypothetical protein
MLGRRWQAVQQYLDCRELLRSGLGVAPMSRLRDLYESVVGTDREPEQHGTDRPVPSRYTVGYGGIPPCRPADVEFGSRYRRRERR